MFGPFFSFSLRQQLLQNIFGISFIPCVLFLYFANRYCILFDFDLPYCNFIFTYQTLTRTPLCLCVNVKNRNSTNTETMKVFLPSYSTLSQFFYVFILLQFFCECHIHKCFDLYLPRFLFRIKWNHSLAKKNIIFLWIFKLPCEIVLPFDRFHRVSGELHNLWANGRNEGKRNYFWKS